MKKIIILIIALAFSFIETNGQCNDRPIINDFTPQTGFIGSTVTITGANFSAIPSENQVFFGATEASIVSSTFGTLEVRVPEGSTTALISVKNKCNLSAYSKTHFNGVFCPTPLTNTSYQNVAQELTGTVGAYNMISQDMDNDGKPEVMSVYTGISIAENNSTPGNINFINHYFNVGTCRSIATADFDGDGLKDLVSNSGVFKNTSTGIGNFNIIRITDSRNVSSYQIGVGDINNDGKIDIIGQYGNDVYVAFNISTGPGNFSFTARQLLYNVGTRCNGIQVADVDSDGKADFLGSQGNSNRAVSLRNTTPDGSFTASFEAPEYWSSDSDPSDGTGTYPYRSMIADFDKDGRIDFTTCNFRGSANVAIWRNISTVGNITFAPTINLPSPGSNYRIGVGDVDGDGYPDVVTKSSGANIFSVYKNTTNTAGNITFNTRFDYTSSARAEASGIVIGDFDGDFVPDIATSGTSSRTIRFHRNTGAQNDATPPTVSCRNIVVALSPAGTVTITPEMIDNGSGDACGIESLVLSQTDFTCLDIGENTVTLTATDGAGNQSSCTATVNVQPAAIIVVGQTTVCQGETISASANIGDSYQWKKDGINIPGATTQNYVATTSGDYTVEVTNAGGCSGESIATSFVVNENPTVDISPAGNAFICGPNGTTQLTATQSSIYQWIKNGVDIANATQQTYDATSVGTYSVRVIDLFGCSAVSEPTTITADPAEIVVSGTGNYGNVFPNQNYTQTITISNTGTGILDITNLTLNGADTSSFSLAGFSSPGSIPAGGTTAVDVIFNAPNITTYSAVLSFNSNDCDEDFISIPLNAEITCVAAAFSAVPSNISVNNDAGICGATVNYTAEATGNPTSTITYSFSGDTEGSGSGTGTNSLFNVGTTTVTINATNPCGNVTESFDVTVIDNQAPTAIAQDISIDIDSFGSASITPGMIDDGSNDNCAVASVEFLTGASGGELVTNGGFNSSLSDWTTSSSSIEYRVDGYAVLNGSGELSSDPSLAQVVNGFVVGETYTIRGDYKNSYGCCGAYTGQIAFGVDIDGNEIAALANPGTNWSPFSVPFTATSTSHTVGFRGEINGTDTDIAIDNISIDVPIENITASAIDFDCLNVGQANQVTLLVTDVNGNFSTATANVTVLDTTDPSTPILADVTGQCEATAAVPTTTDNCAGTINGTTSDPLTYSAQGTHVITWTFDDGNGNVITANQNVIVNDTTAPTIVSKPISVTLTANGTVAITAQGVLQSGTDNCTSAIVYTLSQSTFGATDANNSPVTVQLTGTDASGNATIVPAQVTVIDPLPIVITQNITIELDENGEATINAAQIDNGSNSVVGLAEEGGLSLDISSFNCSNIGNPVTVTLTATSVLGTNATATAVVAVEDKIAPTITLNGDATITHNAFTAHTDAGATADDNCGTLNVIVGGDVVDVNTVGSYVITYDAKDASGNNATQVIRTVNVVDVTNPIAIAQDITVQLDANGNATIIASDIDNGSSDDSGNVTLSLDETTFNCDDINDVSNKYSLNFDGINDYVQLPGTWGGIGFSELTVEAWVYNDGTTGDFQAIASSPSFSFLHFQMATGGNNAVYTNGGDIQLPIISQTPLQTWKHVAIVIKSGNSRVYVNGIQLGNALGVTFNNLLSTNNFSIGRGYNGGRFMKGSIDELRIWNVARSQADISTNMNTSLLGTEPGLFAYYDFEDGPNSGVLIDRTGNGNNGALVNMDNANDWIAGANSLVGIGSPVILTVTDSSNNSSTATATVTVEDTILPEITVPADITNVFATSAAGAVVNYTTPVGTDNCSVTTEMTAGLADGSTFPIGTTVVTYVATDGSENTALASFNVEVVGIAPVIAVPANITVNTDANECGALVPFAATDATGIPNSVITYDIQPNTFFEVGIITVTAKATNAVGTSILTFDVTVVDNVNPIAIAQNVVVQLDASGNGSTTAALVDNGSNDACGIASLALSKTAFTCENIGEHTVTLTVTDNSGNESTETATIIVEDTIAPVVLTKDITVELDENGEVTITPEDIQKESIWIAYLNVFELPENGGGYFDGEVTDLNSLQTDINEEAGTVTLKPNFSKYVAGDPVWSNGNIGNKIIQASTYVEETALVGQSFAFSGNVISNTLDTSYQNYAFVRIFTEDFTLLEEIRYPLVQGETFSVQYNNTQPDAVYVQYGFTVEGLNGNPANEEALGNILVEARTVLTDACGESFVIDKAAFSCNNIGENTVTLTVTDNNGNVSSAMALVTIEDTIAPTIIAQDITVQLNDVDIDENSIANVFDATTLFSTGFEEYSKGETIAWPHNSSWETWSTISAQSTTIDEDITWSASKSMRVDNDDDILLNVGNLISNPTGAKRYAFKSKVYVPAGVSAEFNFQCNFERSCWIAQFGLRGNGEIHLNHDIIEGKSFPNDQWVTVIVIIDGISEKATLLVNDEYVTQFNWSESELFYGINFYNTSGDGTSYYLDDLEFVDITAPNTNQLVNNVSDNCSPLFVYADPASFDCSTVGENTVDLVVLDLSFNSAKDQAVIVVEDSVAPTAVAQDITVTLDEYGNATITPEEVDNDSFDNCTYMPSIDVTTFDCTNIGIQNTVILTVTDASGNTDSTTANVTILEHFKETLDLRSLSSFEAFTGTGAITNAGAITGDVGTNVGALTGFTGPSFIGNVYFNDALTTQADIDLMKVYIHLNNIFETHPGTHAPAFGSGETLYPGVYSIGGAGSVAGTLTLDGQGDPNAVFILKFKGAFTAGAATNIILTDGANAANVYWVAQGALSVGANSTIKGTLLAYPGAITLGVNSSIEGRLLSSVGAITVAAGGTAIMPGVMNIPINPMVSYTPAAAVDVLGSIENFSLFTSNGAVSNAATSGILGDVGADVGAITGFATSAIIGSYYNADAVTAQAKIDLNNAYTQLMLIPNTVSSHTPAFGSGETLAAGVYTTAGAGSLAGTITLDGAGDEDAIFIFKFNGAFAAGAQSRVILSNGTRRCNVFWISEGAASIGSFSTIKGTVIAHNGAATMGAGGNLEGRLLSTGGAIGFSTSVVYTVVHDVECDSNVEQKTSSKSVLATENNPESRNEILVYPNPSNGVFNIKLANLNVKTTVYVIDTAGRIMASESISKENNSGGLIEIGNYNLSSGIYLVKIITKDETVTKKLLIQRK